MNFGSEYVYVYNRSDSESVSDDSGDEGATSSAALPTTARARSSASARPVRKKSAKRASFAQNLSASVRGLFSGQASSSSAAERSQAAPASANPLNITCQQDQVDSAQAAAPTGISPEAKKKKWTKHVRKADPNVFTVNVGSLVTPNNLQQTGGKYIECRKCSSVLTGYSQFEVDSFGGTSHWKCEFCGEDNFNLNTEGWQKPTDNDATYLLEAAPQLDASLRKEDGHNVIFVIDTSGSMSSTERVDRTDANGRTTASFVSRLDAVKTAAESQILQLNRESPNVRVGLVSFESSVHVLGDGSRSQKTFSNARSFDREDALAFGRQQPALRPLKESSAEVLVALSRLADSGMTALGPGLLVAIAMAGTQPGSKIIICTDGCANVGIGTLPGTNASEEEISSCRSVYRGIGELARDSGIEVSVISLQGTDCRLVHLGMVAQITGGVVDIVDQANLDNQFGNILSSRTLATEVTATIQLFHGLYIRDENQEEQLSRKVERVGNASADTDIFVEFGVRRTENENEDPVSAEVEDQRENANTDAAGAAGGTATSQLAGLPDSLPFQVRVTFTTRDGAKYLRVSTADRKQTKQRDEAEAAMDLNVVGAATSRMVSNIALTGAASRAKYNIKGRKKMAHRYRAARNESDSDQDMYHDELEELGGLVQEQQRVSERMPHLNLAQQQHCMPDVTSHAYMARTSKSTAVYAQKKAMKKK